MSVYIKSENRRAVVRDKGTSIQEKACSPRYRTVDPLDIYTNVRDHVGPDVTVQVRRHPRSLWRDFVIVERAVSRDIQGDAFRSGLSILLDHSGRKSVQFTPYAIRVACENQFTMPFWSFSHTEPEADSFLSNPWSYISGLLDKGYQVAERLRVLRPVGPGRDRYHTLASGEAYEAGKRGLSAALVRPRQVVWGGALRPYEDTPWGVLQTMTATRKPALVRAASELLWNPDTFYLLQSGRWPHGALRAILS